MGFGNHRSSSVDKGYCLECKSDPVLATRKIISTNVSNRIWLDEYGLNGQVPLPQCLHFV